MNHVDWGWLFTIASGGAIGWVARSFWYHADAAIRHRERLNADWRRVVDARDVYGPRTLP